MHTSVYECRVLSSVRNAAFTTCGSGFAGCSQLSRYQEGRLERIEIDRVAGGGEWVRAGWRGRGLDRVARVGGVGEGRLERQERE